MEGDDDGWTTLGDAAAKVLAKLASKMGKPGRGDGCQTLAGHLREAGTAAAEGDRAGAAE